MAKSVLEKEFSSMLFNMRSSAVAHDRGVLFGFLLTLVPFFPVPIFGLVISVFNYKIWKSGGLNNFEGKMIKRALVLGLINTIIGASIFYLVACAVLDVGWGSIFRWFVDKGVNLLNQVHGFQQGTKGVSI